MEHKFCICRHCGNLIAFIEDSGAPVICCGEEMEVLIPGTTDAAQEKHVPVIVRNGNKVTVKVGSVPHPMTEQHYIMWIALGTKDGLLLKKLTPSDAPEAEFLVDEGEDVTAYEFCNLHNLWKA